MEFEPTKFHHQMDIILCQLIGYSNNNSQSGNNLYHRQVTVLFKSFIELLKVTFGKGL